MERAAGEHVHLLAPSLSQFRHSVEMFFVSGRVGVLRVQQRYAILITSYHGLKTTAMMIYSALTGTRQHTRMIPGVPESAKRRFFNRG